MPLLVYLKEPRIFIVAQGAIEEGDVQRYDDLFGERCIMLQRRGGKYMVVPLSQASNVAYIEDVTEEELERRQKESMAKAVAQQEGVLARPTFLGVKKGN